VEGNTAIFLKDFRITELELMITSIQDAQAVEKIKLAELELVLREHMLPLGQGIEEQTYMIQASTLSQALRDAEDARTSSAVAAAEATAHSLSISVQELKADLDSERLTSAQYLEERLGLESELQELKSSYTTSKVQSETQLATIIQLQRTVEELKHQQEAHVTELKRLTDDRVELFEKLRVAEAGKTSLLEQFEAAKGKQVETETALAQAQEYVKALGAQLMGTDEVLNEARMANTELKNQVNRSQKDIENLKVDLANSTERALGLASELEKKDKDIAELMAQKADVLSNVASLTGQLQAANQAVATSEKDKDAVDMDLTKAKSELDRLVLECVAGDLRRQELEAKVSATEVMRDRLLDDLTARQNDIQDLLSQLKIAEVKATELESNLELEQARWKVTANDYNSTIAILESSLISTKNEVDAIQSRVDKLVAEINNTKSQLNDSRVQCARVQSFAEAEKRRARDLEDELTKAVARVEDVEEELVLLQNSKDADAVTIANLKDGFSRLQKAQLSSLAELENEVRNLSSSLPGS
jgi:chromosome segregation ATPase